MVRREHITRERREDEVCDYCYQSRVFQAENGTHERSSLYEKFEAIAAGMICVCGPVVKCRDAMCGYHRQLDGRKSK